MRSIYRFSSALVLSLAWARCAFAADGVVPDFGVLSLLPPVIAIGLCVVTKEVIPALFVGSWVAGTMLAGWNPVVGFGNAVESLWNGLGDPWGARIVLTCLTMGGLVGVMQVGGGVDAAVRWLSKKISSSRRAMFFTELSGFVIFFEDYVNTAVVGTTMAPVSDRYRVSKEKLSYIVDSTAAPIACIAGISSWVAYMVGQIGMQFNELGIEASAYVTYLKSIPFVIYNVVALALLTYVVLSGRDFGPMLTAERRARKTGKLLREGAQPLSSTDADPDLSPADETPRRVINFVLPLFFLIGTIFSMLVITGGWPNVGLAEAIGEGSSSKALVYGAFGGTFMTIVLYSLQGLAPLSSMFRGFMKGAQSIFVGSLILIFAWGIGSAIKSVGTAGYIVSVAGDILSPGWIPLLTFFVGAVISFCTGTSYGTMGILMPIVVPLVASVSANGGVDPMTHMVPTIGAVFAGAVWGDHCSPISDTTIMSSMFSGADHMDHVNTQAPYAMLAAVGAGAGYVGVAMGLGAPLCLLLAVTVALVSFHVISSPVEDYRPEQAFARSVSTGSAD
ncbi:MULTISPECIES: Na+/H+ antiporter NhaC family protein [Dethiosulfovibrio]|uniref:Na+/H+ antiporter NhaC family protein n=2 Tax=Dethiosulfovibrio TaxID=47054 RepID=A0ABS9EPV8_9BACT|nr:MULTISPECIES: Na+/H+ antiporter NhaC family protein [Dethiosulfovibrio]MCF4114833.1 Na+/H+ antiporter NhaC family protein [Dethiosulfovibrio russensis]MCF4143230.1 Na+/H+ antiporter NhaC family protein [Dethiosulfovibrio marinus]MCF4145338.1 Na+/H+ antiporter NhaC family protein [Dethiosulfovibrio acidaminovorans]